MTTHSSILAREALEKCDHIFPREISPCWWSDFTGAGGEGWALGTCWAVSRMLLVEPKAEVVGVQGKSGVRAKSSRLDKDKMDKLCRQIITNKAMKKSLTLEIT